MASIQLGPSGEITEDTQIQFTPEERVYQLRAEVERLRIRIQKADDEAEFLYSEIKRLRDLVTILLENDPEDTLENGTTVFDLWRRDAKSIVKPRSVLKA